MIKNFFTTNSNKSRVLVVPLDWGLGHATRCIPLIKALLKNDVEVIIAAEKGVKLLLQHEFQALTFIPITGYRISYSKTKYWLPFKMLIQTPSICISIYKERRWLKKVVKKYSINAVFSDNRFGLYRSDIPSVYLTHQLLIKTGSLFTDKIAQKIHYWFIKKYTYCWVPDFEGAANIAGELSHPLNKLPNTSYIGCLSRFEKKTGFEKKYDLLVMISGPEPQRTIFENLLFVQLQNYSGKALLIRGLPGANNDKPEQLLINQTRNLVIKNHLGASELNEAIVQSEIVISRSGYTTVMDLIKLEKKAMVIPTPGQTEQEYLATHLMSQHIFYSTSQQYFNLQEALKQATFFPFAIPTFEMEEYKKAIQQFVQSL